MVHLYFQLSFIILQKLSQIYSQKSHFFFIKKIQKNSFPSKFIKTIFGLGKIRGKGRKKENRKEKYIK